MPQNNEQGVSANFYRALGLAEIVNDKRKINKILRLASFAPDFSYEKEADKKGRIYFDRYKFLGSGFGVNVHGYRRMRTNKDGQRVEKHVVMDWGIFAMGYEDNVVAASFVDTDEYGIFYCFTEDLHSSNNFEFRVNNILELLDKYRHCADYEAVLDFEADISYVNTAMLMIYATVLLPVDKSHHEEYNQMLEEQIFNELVARARMGDAEAEYSLEQMVFEQEMELGERLAHEDLLSVFEGYFLNLAEQSGIFSILADILSVEEVVNEASNQKLYRLNISITDTKTTVYINQEDLIGMPMVGMRLMGIGLLQGTILLDRPLA
ncbi:MAG: DUF3881 family protein [Clostridiales bacterium]|nr:DUF3881 family protein [Clostridiales bacterium]